MRLSDKQYKILKWVISIVLPALIVFLSVVFDTIGWQYTEPFLQIAVAFEVFLGTVFKVSEHKYDKEVK